MSIITKEWLQQTIAEMKEHRDLFPGDLDDDHANVLAALRIALASLEAEAVCVIDQSNLDYLKSGSDADVWPASRTEMGDVLLYRTSPPVPVSVTDYPETLPCPVMLEPGLKFGKGVPTRTMLDALQRRAEYYAELEAMTPEQRAEHDAGMKEFAAMLHGADGNSPDGWVACSERMPEENSEQEVLACFKGGDISTLYYFEGRWDDTYGIVPIRQDVTHWMPLPAAPQREVKS
ncbi:DUF551 domain-containing protein [Enterobacter cloacae complex sp. 2024EL-00227]|uniref:DUF551 domain-containing protein n=1 Tax=Enterobacter cloacae complex sp. 2024EL-00227 TaxID=3374272 RepID=UPI003753CECD